MIRSYTIAGGGNHSREGYASRPHILFILPLLLSLSFTAQALTQTQSIDSINITVYAPDWIWQKNAVNILITLENTGDQPVDCTLRLNIPLEFADHFQYDNAEAENQPVTIPPGETVRHAFTNIIAAGDVERQTYDFTIDVTIADTSTSFDYSLTTIRGPAVSGAKWAMFLPAIICVLWSVVFVFVLKRYAQPGAWKTPSQLDHSKIPEEPWMDETP